MQFSHQTWPYPDAQTHPSLIKIIFPRLFEETTLLCTLHSPIPFPTFPPIPQQKKRMSQPIFLSDEEDDHQHFPQNALSTPLHFASKKQRFSDPDPNPNAPDIVLIDDPTPQKPGPTSTPSFVPETPLSAPNSDLVIVKCTTANSSNPQPRVSDPDHNKFSG